MSRAWLCALLIAASPLPALAQRGDLAGDADGDAKLSLAEFKASRSQLIARADRDGDGKLSPAEWIAGETRVRRELEAVGVNPRTTDLGSGGYGKVDADDDGFVSAAETDAYLDRRFASLDANKDGGVDRQELRAAYGR